MKLFFRQQLGAGRFVALMAGLLQAASIAWPTSGHAWGSLQILSLMFLSLGLVRCAASPAPDRHL